MAARTRDDRMRHAKRLYLEGASRKVIAQQSKTKEATVKYWISAYHWDEERTAKAECEVVSLLPGLASADLDRMKGAFDLYAASNEARIALVKSWVSNCKGENLNSLEQMGRRSGYKLPDLHTRKRFVNDIQMFNELISDARKEIDVIRSMQKKSNTSKKADGGESASGQEQTHLRIAK